MFAELFFKTLKEFEQQSETAAEQKPMKALRTYFPYANSNCGKEVRN